MGVVRACIDGRVVRHDVVCTCQRIVFSLGKDILAQATAWTNTEDAVLREITDSLKRTTLHDSTSVKRSERSRNQSGQEK